MPQAQQHLALLPEELSQRCISPALSSERPLARLLQPIKVRLLLPVRCRLKCLLLPCA